MGERNINIVKKMINRSERIMSLCKGLNMDSFLSNEDIIEICAFNLMQIGELVCSLDDSFVALHTHIPWNKIRWLRHRIVHDYIGVDLNLIWEVISINLPELTKELKDLVL